MSKFIQILTGICVVTVSLLVPIKVRAQETLPRFESGDCPTTPPNYRVECGYLLVPEDRSQSDSATIKIAVAILKASNPNPQPDPILIVNGGPGGDALRDLPRFVNIFPFLTSDPNRDVIIFDQRGVGLSQPALACNELAPIFIKPTQGQSISQTELTQAYAACRDGWLAHGVNLAAYSTADSAADIADLWRTLGYSQVNLYGVSYGTVLAQVVARDYPEGIRSLVLDSAYPLNSHLLADTAPNLNASLKRVFADCAADWACHLAFPDLENTYANTIERLTREPATLTLTDPTTDQTLHYPFAAADFVEALRFASARTVPVFIDNIHDGDYSAILTQLRIRLENAQQFGPPPNRAMAYSVMCGQQVYAVTPEQLEANTIYPESVWAERFIQRDLLPLPCTEWPHREADPKDAQPWTTDIPTLILQGADDGTLSPNYDQLFTATFRHGTILTIPDTSHGVLTTNLCANTLVRSFFSDPTQTLARDCLAQQLLRLDFKYTIRASATAWPMQFLSLVLGLGIGWAGLNTFIYSRCHHHEFSLRHTFRLLGWPLAAVTLALTALGLLGGLKELGLQPAETLATLLPPLAALQAAFLFSPEDEPALEVTLATPRPLAWTLIERLSGMTSLYLLIGLAGSAFVTVTTDESIPTVIARWLPPLIALAPLSVCITLITRRAVLGVSLISLLWFALYFLGGYMIQTWPFAWPLHLYLQPDHAFFWLNRLTLTLIGFGFIINAAARLVRDEERLLLGNRGFARKATVASVIDRLQIPNHDVMSQKLSAPQQLFGLIRYEFLMQWRQFGPAIFVTNLLLVPIANAFLIRNQFAGLQASAVGDGAQADYARALITNALIPPTALVGLALCLTLLVISVTDTVPKDQQLGVRELLNALPMSTGIYLFGKLLSLWATFGVGLIFAIVLSTVVSWLVVGPFNLGIYLEMWLVGIGSLVLINSALALLLTAAQPSTRRALWLGVLFAAANVGSLFIGYLSLNSPWSHFIPSRPALNLFYLFGYPGADILSGSSTAFIQAIGRVTSRPAVFLDLAAGFSEVVVLYIIVWWWLKRREV